MNSKTKRNAGTRSIRATRLDHQERKARRSDVPTEIDALRASDARIQLAMDSLNSHERGRAVLRSFKAMAKAGAMGLDVSGCNALVTLTKELCAGRRTFLDKIEGESARRHSFCSYCGEPTDDGYHASDRCPQYERHQELERGSK